MNTMENTPDHIQHLYGLIGYPLSHSFSRRYFTEKFEREGINDHAYMLFPIEKIAELPVLLTTHPTLRGLNVTIPHKQAVIPLLDEVREEARAVGAVNTIVIRDGRLTGYNTDVYGFELSMKRFLDTQLSRPEAALVLGAGGSSRAVIFALSRLGIAVTVVSRSPQPGQLAWQAVGKEVLEKHRLIVNTTPLGMAPRTGDCPPLPYELLTANHLLFDLVYNPEKTLFLARGEEKGCAVKNGLEMLYLQAERSWEIWNRRE